MPEQIQVTKTLYRFKELIAAEKDPNSKVTSQAVERARQTLIEWSASNDVLDEYVWEHCWKTALQQIGFVDQKLAWSGFASQGDGASFSGKIDVEKLLWFMSHKIKPKKIIEGSSRTTDSEDFVPWIVHKLNGCYGYNPQFRKLKKSIDFFDMKVERTDHRYLHSNSCNIDYNSYAGFPDDLNELLDEFYEAAKELRYSLCQAIYKDLQEEYYALSEDEALIEYDQESVSYPWDDKGNIDDDI